VWHVDSAGSLCRLRSGGRRSGTSSSSTASLSSRKQVPSALRARRRLRGCRRGLVQGRAPPRRAVLRGSVQDSTSLANWPTGRLAASLRRRRSRCRRHRHGPLRRVKQLPLPPWVRQVPRGRVGRCRRWQPAACWFAASVTGHRLTLTDLRRRVLGLGRAASAAAPAASAVDRCPVVAAREETAGVARTGLLRG
jgi:hypothetical protein